MSSLLTSYVAWGTGVALLAATVLPLVATHAWWVRFFDFPRLQVAGLILALLATAPFVLDFAGWPAWALVAALGAAGAEQARRILPFTPLHAVQVIDAGACAPGSRLSVLIANVLVTNRDAAPLIDMVRRSVPDIFLAVETDGWWDDRLSALATDYPHVVRRPQTNGYGMHLFSRLPLVGTEVTCLLDDDIPSIHTGVRMRSGAMIGFHGIHPQPPHVGQDTAERDAELVIVGRRVRAHARPAIVAGDLNDVAWSRTNELFQKVSGLLDPRIGRGIYPTFHAHWRLLRWPLDHVFTDPRFTVVDLKRMEHIGSDHFPIWVALCLTPDAASEHEAPVPTTEDLREAREAVAAGVEDVKRDDRPPAPRLSPHDGSAGAEGG